MAVLKSNFLVLPGMVITCWFIVFFYSENSLENIKVLKTLP